LRYRRYHLYGRRVGPREPIHLGRVDGRRPGGSGGEPILLLHPFMMSSYVWKEVAPRLADTGRFEVFAPTMAGHNGGPHSRSWFLDTTTLANHVEAQLDELGWTTAHVVGNSLGGWVAFELERRGRARTLTAIAPAGGWHRWSPVKYEIVAKFVAGAPVWLTALLLPGLMELTETSIPTNLVICERDRVLPHPRFTKHFLKHIPAIDEVTKLDGVGHIPMFEAPERVADLIIKWVDAHTAPEQRAEDRGA
jgi:pimeloyl-ACP methyl ester carboxylesterase